MEDLRVVRRKFATKARQAIIRAIQVTKVTQGGKVALGRKRRLPRV